MLEQSYGPSGSSALVRADLKERQQEARVGCGGEGWGTGEGSREGEGTGVGLERG